MKNIHCLALLVVVVITTCMVSSCKPDPLQPPVIKLKPSVTIQPATNVTISSATLVASVVPNQDGTTVSFEYKIAAAVTDWKIVTLPTTYSGKTSVNVTLDISNLSSQTEYSYRVKATSATGQSISAINTFATLVAPVKPGVAIKPATNVEITKASLMAKVVPNENGTTVSFEYKTLATSTWMVAAVSGTFTGKDSVAVSVTLNTLVANTDYIYRVKASNLAGETISSESNFQTYAIKDYDGNYYHTVTIGTQVWLKENLKTTHFANGDLIPNVTDATAWINLTTSAYCWYNNDPEIGKTYGALYNWHVTKDSRGLIAGYHVSTDEEWTTLMNSQGGYNLAGGRLKETGLAHWKTPNTSATNESGFTALPSGAIDAGLSCDLSVFGYFWSSTEFGSGALVKHVQHNSSYFENDLVVNKRAGLSLRLIKN